MRQTKELVNKAEPGADLLHYSVESSSVGDEDTLTKSDEFNVAELDPHQTDNLDPLEAQKLKEYLESIRPKHYKQPTFTSTMRENQNTIKAFKNSTVQLNLAECKNSQMVGKRLSPKKQTLSGL